MKFIGMIVCWWRGEHDYPPIWQGLRYTDGRTYYWTRTCLRCGRINSTLEYPNEKARAGRT